MTGVCDLKHTMEEANKTPACSHITRTKGQLPDQLDAVSYFQSFRVMNSLVSPLLQPGTSSKTWSKSISARWTFPTRSWCDHKKTLFFFFSCGTAVLSLGLLSCTEHCSYHEFMFHRVDDVTASSWYHCFCSCTFSAVAAQEGENTFSKKEAVTCKSISRQSSADDHSQHNRSFWLLLLRFSGLFLLSKNTNQWS